MSRLRLYLPAALGALAMAAPLDVLMNRYDLGSTAANTHETILNQSNVKAATFGKLYSYYVDGTVFAQPLHVSSAARNVLYVATMNDKVYAFDADRKGPPLWVRDLTNEAAGVTPVPVTDITNNADLNVVGNVGIMGTPVIDAESRSLYLVARTRENGQYMQRLHKLDLRDGKDQVPPAVIDAAVKSSAKDAVNGELHFDAKGGNQRTGLVLVNGAVVIAWASHEDIRPYHGWVMAYDAKSLKQRAVFCASPDGTEGGIWQSGRGPAVDASGAIYYEVGNGHWDGARDWGTSLVKLRLGASGFTVEDYFTPHDYEELNKRDADLGSTGPMLLPGTSLLLAGSKAGILYILDTKKLGHMTATDEAVLQAVEVEGGGRVMAGPAYWNGSVYLWNDADVLKAFRFDGKKLEPAAFAKSAVQSKGSPGGALTISSDGAKAGTAIVWATLTNGKSADHGNAQGVLRAYNAETLQELWNSEEQRRRDRLGTLVKFNPPLVVNGKVYVPNYDSAVNVYGLVN